MKSLRLACVLLLPLLTVACSTATSTSLSSTPGSAASLSFQPPAGQAGLYIYKKGSLIGAADAFQVNLDGQLLGQVASEAYVYTVMNPGVHTITAGTAVVTLSAQAGQNYFIRQKTNLDASGQIVSTSLFKEKASTAVPIIKNIQKANSAY
jgi:hypothetical protein